MTENRLSDKQKSVLKLMRDGRYIFKNVTYVILAGDNSLRRSTVFALHKRGLIFFSERDKNGFWVGKLTKLGKTIKL